ncbi:hypothetical protein GCM10020219_088300 [Nonomuraea dietziae]
MQNLHGSALPPSWKATWAFGRLTGAVKTWWWAPGSGPSAGEADRYCVQGSTGSWINALATLAGPAEAEYL